MLYIMVILCYLDWSCDIAGGRLQYKDKDRIILTIWIPILARCLLYIESAPGHQWPWQSLQANCSYGRQSCDQRNDVDPYATLSSKVISLYRRPQVWTYSSALSRQNQVTLDISRSLIDFNGLPEISRVTLTGMRQGRSLKSNSKINSKSQIS